MNRIESLKTGAYAVIAHLSLTNKIQITVPFNELDKSVTEYCQHILATTDMEAVSNNLMKVSIDFKNKN